MEKTPFKETKAYSVVFMMLITIFFVGILAFFYHSTQPRVKEYQKIKNETIILSLFDFPLNNVHADYAKYIKEKNQVLNGKSVVYYEAVKDTTLVGYAFPISGKGLWGNLEGVVSLSPDLKTIINFTITGQSETPGLGGRITEPGFIGQFKNRNRYNGLELIKLKLTQEDNKTPAPNEIRQLTGATLTTNYVLNLLQISLPAVLKDFRK